MASYLDDLNGSCATHLPSLDPELVWPMLIGHGTQKTRCPHNEQYVHATLPPGWKVVPVEEGAADSGKVIIDGRGIARAHVVESQNDPSVFVLQLP